LGVVVIRSSVCLSFFPATYLAQQHPPRRQTKGMLCALVISGDSQTVPIPDTLASHFLLTPLPGVNTAVHPSRVIRPRVTSWWTVPFAQGLPVLVARPSRFKASAIA
jgi:hypothetical protein